MDFEIKWKMYIGENDPKNFHTTTNSGLKTNDLNIRMENILACNPIKAFPPYKGDITVARILKLG